MLNDTKDDRKASSFDQEQKATLTMHNSIVSKEYYNDYIKPHIDKTFPNVMIEHLHSSDSGNGNGCPTNAQPPTRYELNDPKNDCFLNRASPPGSLY